jgi:hypothetical protein
MIRTSESIDELSKALVAAQGDLKPVEKGADNSYFKSKYADLASVVKVVNPILKSHGLAVTQMPGVTEDGNDVLTTRLIHESGQWQEATMRLILTKQDAQGLGSAITYARRYAYSAVLGIITEQDDDGNEASKPAQQTTRRSAPQSSGARHSNSYASSDGEKNGHTVTPGTGIVTEKQIGLIHKLFDQKNFADDREYRHDYAEKVLGCTFASTKELTKVQAGKLIDALLAEPDAEDPL